MDNFVRYINLEACNFSDEKFAHIFQDYWTPYNKILNSFKSKEVVDNILGLIRHEKIQKQSVVKYKYIWDAYPTKIIDMHHAKIDIKGIINLFYFDIGNDIFIKSLFDESSLNHVEFNLNRGLDCVLYNIEKLRNNICIILKGIIDYYYKYPVYDEYENVKFYVHFDDAINITFDNGVKIKINYAKYSYPFSFGYKDDIKNVVYVNRQDIKDYFNNKSEWINGVFKYLKIKYLFYYNTNDALEIFTKHYDMENFIKAISRNRRYEIICPQKYLVDFIIDKYPKLHHAILDKLVLQDYEIDAIRESITTKDEFLYSVEYHKKAVDIALKMVPDLVDKYTTQINHVYGA